MRAIVILLMLVVVYGVYAWLRYLAINDPLNYEDDQ